MSVTRRGFIGGIIASVASGEALVRLADPKEQSLIKTGDMATVLAPHNFIPEDFRGNAGQFYLAIFGPDDMQYEMLGYAIRVEVNHGVDTVDTTTLDGAVRELRQLPGRRHGHVSLTAPLTPDNIFTRGF